MRAFQQHDDGTTTAIHWPCLNIGKHRFLLHQPVTHMLPEHGFPVFRAQTLAVNDADTTSTPSPAFVEEVHYFPFGLQLGQAM